MIWHKSAEMKGHAAPVYACVADGSFIYSAAGDRFVTRWDPVTGLQDDFAVRLDSPAYCLESIPKEKLLVAGCTNGTIVAVNITERTLAWEHNFHGKALFSLADCPQQKCFVAGDQDGNLLVISYSGNLLATFHLDCGKIRKIRVSTDFLIIACQDGTWRKFELPTLNELVAVEAHKGGVTALCLNPLSNVLITGGKDAFLRIWDLYTNVEIAAFPAHYQTIYDILAIEGKLISVSMDKTIKIWNPDEWKVEQRIEFRQGGHSRSVNGCIAVDNGFATFSDDKTIRFWSKST